MDILLVIIGFFFIAIYFQLCSDVGEKARRLKRSGGYWFFLSLIMTPLLAVIMVHCLGEDSEKNIHETEEEKILRELRRKSLEKKG